MSLTFDKESPTRREETTAYSPPAPFAQPAPGSQPAPDFMLIQYGAGNSALANTVLNTSSTLFSNAPEFQSAYGNAVVARAAEARQARTASFDPSAIEMPPVGETSESKPASVEAGTIEKPETNKAPQSNQASAEVALAEKGATYKTSQSKPSEAGTAATSAPVPRVEAAKPSRSDVRDPVAMEEDGSAERMTKAPEEGKEKESKIARAAATTKAVEQSKTTGEEDGAADPSHEAAAELAPVSITASDPGGILEQLTSVPPTQAAAAHEKAGAVSALALENQKAEAQQSLPEIPAPTGLPARESAAQKQVTGENAKTPATERTGEKSGREQAPYETRVEQAPPISPSPSAELGDAGRTEQEKNAEMARNAQAALDTVFINTAEVSTSAGERPSVDATGDADPSQMESFEKASGDSVRTGKLEAAREISTDFGENDIFPAPSNETIKTNLSLAGASPSAVKAAEPLSLPPEAVGGLNESLGPVLAERIGEKKEEYDLGEEKFARDKAAAHQKADDDTALLEAEARETQLAEKGKAKDEVAGAREEWRTELSQVEKDYQQKAGKAGKEQRSKIAEEKKKGEKEAAKHLDEAEKKAGDEKKKSEQEVEKKKKEKKKESGGFWGWAKRAAKALIDGLKAAVNFIYDNLRKAVKVIFEIAKKLVLAAIELARKVLVTLIKGFGEILKGLVSIVFFAFPDIKKKINARIDKAVDIAVRGVNKAAELLKKGVVAVLDFLAKTIDSLLGLVQSLYNGIFTIIGMIISGELQELMRRIGYLIDAAKTVPDQFETAALEELLGGNLDNPLSPGELSQAGIAPPSAGKDGAAPSETAEPSELPSPPFSESNVGVDEVDSGMELSPELADELAAKTNGEGEIELASSEDKTRTMAAALAEVAPNTDAGAKAGEQEETKYPDDGLNPTQRAEIKWKLMKQGIANWWSENWLTVSAAAAVAILGFIALNIVTGGAITAALPVIMSIVGPLFAGLTILQLVDHVKNYLEQGWNGQIRPAGKSLAKGLAAGAIELISYLTFKAGGALLKGARILAKGSLKLAKTGLKLIARGTKFVVSKGKILFQGIARSGIGKMFTRLKDLGEGLLKRMRFRKFRITLSGRWFKLEGFINPWILLATGEIKKIPNPKDASGKTTSRLRKGERIVDPETGVEGIIIGGKDAKKLKYRPTEVKKAAYVEKTLTGEPSLLAKRLGTPSGEQAHHLIASSVAQEHRAAREAAKHGWDLNHAKNGLNIPHQRGKLKTPDGRDIWHHGNHTDAYFDAVGKELDVVWDTFNSLGKPTNFNWIGEMNKVSERISKGILSGKIKLYK